MVACLQRSESFLWQWETQGIQTLILIECKELQKLSLLSTGRYIKRSTDKRLDQILIRKIHHKVLTKVVENPCRGLATFCLSPSSHILSFYICMYTSPTIKHLCKVLSRMQPGLSSTFTLADSQCRVSLKIQLNRSSVFIQSVVSEYCRRQSVLAARVQSALIGVKIYVYKSWVKQLPLPRPPLLHHWYHPGLLQVSQTQM